MTHRERWSARHPLCTCPESGNAWILRGDPPPDRSQCAGGSIAHPVLSADDIKRVVGTLIQRIEDAP